MAKTQIEIQTPDGVCPAGLFMPEAAPSASVVFYMDIFGPRASLDGMAERLCREGYAVLLPDLFYRAGAYGPFETATAFHDEKVRAALMGLVQGTTPEMTRRDTGAFLQALDDNGARGPVGTVGYCMGGARALDAAASYPERVAAAASFHGANLAGDAPDSPHRRAASIKARVYVGSAGVDRSFPPEQSGRLAEALRAAEVDHVIENYLGMEHGWCVPDHSVYNQAGAERHWRRLTTFFGETLG